MILRELNKKVITKNIIFIFLILLIIFVTSINYPQVISLWESGAIYQIFYPTDKPLLFLAIQKAGETSGYHGIFGYTLLELSRYLADLLGHSISIIRIPSVLYGLLSVILLFIVIKRYFGIETAFISSSLLLTNLHFIIFQNLLLVHSLTLASILFCIERFLNFKSKQSKFAAISLGLAFAFASIHHVAGRLLMLSIMLLCPIDYKIYFKNFKNIITKKSLNNFIIVFISTIVFLSLFYPLNFFRLFTPEFLFSDVGVLSSKEDIIGSDFFFVKKTFHNIKYFIYYFIFGFQEPNYLSNILVGRPFAVVNIIIFIFFIYGLILSLFDIKNFNKFFFIYLGGIIFIAVFQSDVKFDWPFEISSGLQNSNQTIYLVPFIIVFASFGIMAIYKQVKQYGKLAKSLCILFFIGLIFSRLYLFVNEANRFQSYIESYNFDFTKKAIERELSYTDTQYGVLNHKDKIGLHLNQIYFYNLAKHIVEKTGKYQNDKNKIKLIYIPENYYTPNYIQFSGAVPRKDSPYYFQMFLTFYLQERGMNVSYLANLQEVKPSLIYRIIDVVDHYEERKNNPNAYPIDEKQKKTVILIKKVVSWIESYQWGKNCIQSIRQQKNISLKSKIIGDYYINTTSYKNPEYLILSNTSELEAAKLLKDTKIVLVMPEKIDK